MDHRMAIDETVGLAGLAQRDLGGRKPVVVRGQARTKRATGSNARCGLAMVVGPRDEHAAELLGVALEPPAPDGEVGRDPDEHAAAVGDALVLAAHHDERLEVLRAGRIQELGPAGAARLPVGPDERHSAGILGSEVEFGGQDRAHLGRIRAVLDREQGARVVPRHLRHQCTAAGRGQGRQEAGRLGHAASIATIVRPRTSLP